MAGWTGPGKDTMGPDKRCADCGQLFYTEDAWTHEDVTGHVTAYLDWD